MVIAPGIEAKDWKKLNLVSPEGPDWNRAIDILETRFRARFLSPIDFLVAQDELLPPSERRFGFVILSVSCLLVETLEAFSEGLTNTRGMSKRLCVSFLTNRASFKPHFSMDVAKRFYDEFRCGLAHHAQIFGLGKVWSVGPLLRIDGESMIINRTAFHSAVKVELDSYVALLRDPTQSVLRTKFREKMDFVAEGKVN